MPPRSSGSPMSFLGSIPFPLPDIYPKAITYVSIDLLNTYGQNLAHIP